MFGRKSKARGAEPRLTLFDADGARISSCPLGEYALPEAVVLALSSEYFGDPEPCEIHRAAVHKRAMLELLEDCPAGAVCPVERLADGRRRYFPAGVSAILLEEG